MRSELNRCRWSTSAHLYWLCILVFAAMFSTGTPQAEAHGKMGCPPDYMRLVDEVVPDERTAVVVSVETPVFSYYGSSGLASWETKEPVVEESLFRIASCSKTFIATLATLLYFEGKLDLDLPISTYLPPHMTRSIAGAERITVRDLLDHQSGFYDYSDNAEWWAAAMSEPNRIWKAQDVLPYALGEPNTEYGVYDYSNTNYVLMGIILDNVLGEPHALALRERILEPLQLTSTFYEHHDDYDAQRLVQGHFDLFSTGEVLDFSQLSIGTGLASGGLVSNVRDLSRFIRALVTDPNFPADVEKKRLLREMKPVDGAYGLGLDTYDFGYGPVYGHDGGDPGYGSIMLYFIEHDVAIALTIAGFDGGAEQLPDIPGLYATLVKATFAALGVDASSHPKGSKAP